MDTLDRMSAEGQDQAVEKALKDAEKDVYEYEGKTYTAHPAATLFPLIKGDDFEALVASLALNGMRHPVLLLGDQIVDGRNRFRAAKKAGVKITFRQIDPDEDVCVVAMDMNIHRRDLTGNRRVALASTLRRMSIRLEQLRREAMARAARGGPREGGRGRAGGRRIGRRAGCREAGAGGSCGPGRAVCGGCRRRIRPGSGSCGWCRGGGRGRGRGKDAFRSGQAVFVTGEPEEGGGACGRVDRFAEAVRQGRRERSGTRAAGCRGQAVRR